MAADSAHDATTMTNRIPLAGSRSQHQNREAVTARFQRPPIKAAEHPRDPDDATTTGRFVRPAAAGTSPPPATRFAATHARLLETRASRPQAARRTRDGLWILERPVKPNT